MPADSGDAIRRLVETGQAVYLSLHTGDPQPDDPAAYLIPKADPPPPGADLPTLTGWLTRRGEQLSLRLTRQWGDDMRNRNMAALLLHLADHPDDPEPRCMTCRVPSPCPTRLALLGQLVADDDLCPLYDLPRSGCAHCRGIGVNDSLTTGGPGPWVAAQDRGRCACGHTIEPGELIRADGHGGWQCQECPGDPGDH